MDTIFKIITKNDEEVFLGANHFGYEDRIYKACDILVRLALEKGISMNEFHYLEENLYEIEEGDYEDIEVVIDEKQKVILFDLEPNIYKSEEDYQNFEMENIQDLLNERFRFHQFLGFYTLFKRMEKLHKVSINHKYVYAINHS